MANSEPASLIRRKTLKALRITAALLCVAALYIAVVGIAVDVTPQGKEIARELSVTLGREVVFNGAIRLDISARPELRMGGLHIANAGGFGSDEFARLGEARLALNLWPLLWGRLQVDELSGRDAHLRLQMRSDGTNNWTFRKVASPDTAAEPTASTTASGQALALLDIRQVSVDKLDVEYVGTNGHSHYFQLDSLSARLPADQPVSLRINGTVEKSFPYQVEFTGGTLSELIAADHPWPADLSLHFLSSQLKLKGSFTGASGNIHFDLATGNLKELERLLQTRLPAVGHTHVAGDVAFSPSRVQLTKLRGTAGNTSFEGALDVNYGDPRPQLRGHLSLPVLDLGPFMTGQPEAEAAPAKSLAQFYRDLARASFDLHALNDVDADLTLQVGNWLNIPGNVRNAVLTVKLDHGRLAMPIRATLADVTVSGAALVDARNGPARFELTLGARDSGIGNLSGLLFGAPDVNGRLGRFDLRIAARGNRGAGLMESLVVDLGIERAQLAYGNGTGKRPVRFSLDRFKVELPAGKPLRGSAQGTLLDNAFTMSLQGASLTELLQGDAAAIDLALQAGSADARVRASLQPLTDHSGSEVHFALHAPHSSEVSSWLGLKPGADAPVSLEGHYQARAQGWLLSDLALQLGHSRLASEVQQTLENGRPLVRFQLTGDVIDADELKSLLPEAPRGTATSAAPSSSALIDIPVLPQGIRLTDSDITVRIRDIATTSPFTVHDLRFDGRIRDGMMSPSPFSASIAKTDFYGVIMLDLRTRQPRATLSLAADAMDAGALLHQLDLAPHLDARLEHLGIYMDLRSSRLGELIANSELSVSFEGGKLDLHGANSADAMRIALTRGDLRSVPGSPVQLHLDGAVNAAPIRIDVETASAALLLDPSTSIPFKLDAATSGATIRLAGDVDRPFSRQAMELSLDMHGSRFDNLDHLLHASLPPWGPWAASGKLRASADGYEVSSLLLQVGSSRLTGHGKFDTMTQPPRLDIELTAPRIQIDDFRFGNWSPERSPPGAPRSAAPRNDESKASVHQLLSREALQRQNARLLVRVDKVLSGNDVLGNGQLEATLQNGRAIIGPAVVNTPGGTATVQLDYEPGEKDVALNLRAAATHFDYGILARRIDKQSGMAGTFDLDVDVSARATNLAGLLPNGRGHIDFAVWPQNMKSGLLDVWAVNVLMALLPAVDASQESTVNCAIGQFTLRNGKLSHKRVLIDTTRMRVSGRGNADFTNEQIQFYMRPRAKTPQFLSFPLPVELSGSFNDFSVGVRPGDVLETAGQFATSVIWVPLQSLFGTALPADGHDVCRLK